MIVGNVAHIVYHTQKNDLTDHTRGSVIKNLKEGRARVCSVTPVPFRWGDNYRYKKRGQKKTWKINAHSTILQYLEGLYPLDRSKMPKSQRCSERMMVSAVSRCNIP
jgi:hypothetical protein